MLPSIAGPRPVYDSAKRRLPLREEFIEAWRYRDLIVQLVQRDVPHQVQALGARHRMDDAMATSIGATFVTTS